MNAYGKILIVALIGVSVSMANSFLDEQRKAERVRFAEEQKSSVIEPLFKAKGLVANASEILIQVFKLDGEMEIWARAAHSQQAFQKLTTYAICASSGEIGPKRQAGDGQVPEGVYHIERFNPWSNYHLSLGINYPNASDRKRSKASDLGGDIFIHGNCVTIGCMPITDDKIREIYLMAILARDAGQKEIPVYIYPTRMIPQNLLSIRHDYSDDKDRLMLWRELQAVYDAFASKHLPPQVSIGGNGEYVVGK